MSQLAVIRGRQIVREHELVGELVTIGSGAAQALRLEGEDVAARHCYLKREAGGYVLHAQGGATTTVNGTAVRRATLQPGDEIMVGEHLLLFEPLPAQLAQLTSVVEEGTQPRAHRP
jgi:predicted component of type VI protein secretion system